MPKQENVQPDFITAHSLAALLDCSVGDIWNQHCSGRGPLANLLVKVGGRVGVWREDYEIWRSAQRRMTAAGEFLQATERAATRGA